MRKIKSLLLVFIMTLALGYTTTWGQTNFEVQLPNYKIIANEELLAQDETLDIISINKELYVPLTEVAVFWGFHVEADNNVPNTINLVYGNNGEKDTLRQDMIKILQNKNKNIKESQYKIFCQEQQIKAHLLEINGAHFIKLKDIVEFFGCYIYIDNETQTIDVSQISKEDKKAYREYLLGHAFPIDITNGVDKDFIKKTGLDKYNIFLVGESHGIAKNFQIELFFITYFSQNENVRYILSEIGYCDAQLINRYLESGEERILDTLMENLKGTFAYSKEMRGFYQKVYDYNKSLPNDKKLKFIGLDIQHQTDTGTEYLLSLLPQKEVPEAIKTDIDALLKAKKKNDYTFEMFNNISKNLEVNKATYEKYLGQDYESFRLGLINIIQKFKCDNGSEDDFMKIREKKMIENFVNQYSKLENAKCVGMFGSAHTSLNTYFDSEKNDCNLATYIDKKYDESKGKVASITLGYYNSYYMDSQTGKSEKVFTSIIEKLIGDAITGEYTLFPLDDNDSIFKEDGSVKSQQYLLLIKDSNAAQPYDNK